MTLSKANQETLAIAIEAAVKAIETKAGTGVGPYTHGPGGLFSLVDGEHPILSAMVQPMGLLAVLPKLRPDVHYVDKLTTFTGVTADGAGSEPVNVCGTPIEAGLKKLCTLVAPFGRVMRATRPWNVLQLGKLSDRHEELSMTAQFPLSLMQGDNLSPDSIASDGDSVARLELANRLFEVATSFQRTHGPTVYTGNPVNNSSTDPRNAGYKEYIGLDLWINQGNKRDYLSSALCSALDSTIVDFAYANVEDGAIVSSVTDTWRQIRWNSRRMQLDPTTWVISMSPDLFALLADVWPCLYLSNRCKTSDGSIPIVINDDLNTRMRDEMRTGSFLWIDGERVMVVQDMSVPEQTWITDSNLEEGEYASDIYFIPITVLGGMQVTGWQWFDQRTSVNLNAQTRDTRLWTTDDGMYMWTSTRDSSGFCYDMRAVIEPRLLMHTPQLAARILNIMYAPNIHLRQYQPEDTYFKDGGVTNRTVDEFYNQWETTPSTL